VPMCQLLRKHHYAGTVRMAVLLLVSCIVMCAEFDIEKFRSALNETLRDLRHEDAPERLRERLSQDEKRRKEIIDIYTQAISASGTASSTKNDTAIFIEGAVADIASNANLYMDRDEDWSAAALRRTKKLTDDLRMQQDIVLTDIEIARTEELLNQTQADAKAIMYQWVSKIVWQFDDETSAEFIAPRQKLLEALNISVYRRETDEFTLGINKQMLQLRVRANDLWISGMMRSLKSNIFRRGRYLTSLKLMSGVVCGKKDIIAKQLDDAFQKGLIRDIKVVDGIARIRRPQAVIDDLCTTLLERMRGQDSNKNGVILVGKQEPSRAILSK
jgi:hypothetical protein